MIWIVWTISLLSLVFAGFLMRDVLKQPAGTPKMKEIAKLIQDGSKTFMKRQYRTIAILTIGVAILLYGDSTDGLIRSFLQTFKLTFTMCRPEEPSS